MERGGGGKRGMERGVQNIDMGSRIDTSDWMYGTVSKSLDRVSVCRIMSSKHGR